MKYELSKACLLLLLAAGIAPAASAAGPSLPNPGQFLPPLPSATVPSLPSPGQFLPPLPPAITTIPVPLQTLPGQAPINIPMPVNIPGVGMNPINISVPGLPKVFDPLAPWKNPDVPPSVFDLARPRQPQPMRNGLPPVSMDSFVFEAAENAELIYGDEGVDDIPPYDEFTKEHRINNGIFDQRNRGLTTGHGSYLPDAWGGDEWVDGPEWDMSGAR